MSDRRVNPDPHPAPGCPERRHCSDVECTKARQAWYEEVLVPKISVMLNALRWEFWKGIIVTILTCMCGIFFIVSALIDKHTLDATNTMGREYIHIQRYNADIEDIKRRLTQVEVTVHNSIEEVKAEVIQRLDRNLAEIKDRKK